MAIYRFDWVLGLGYGSIYRTGHSLVGRGVMQMESHAPIDLITKKTDRGRMPYVNRWKALASHCDGLLRDGTIASYRDRYLGLTNERASRALQKMTNGRKVSSIEQGGLYVTLHYSKTHADCFTPTESFRWSDSMQNRNSRVVTQAGSSGTAEVGIFPTPPGP